jgi:hypothetical protein
LLELRLMVAPPVGAAALRVMFRFAVLPLTTVVGLTVTLLIVGSVAAAVAKLLTPQLLVPELFWARIA